MSDCHHELAGVTRRGFLCSTATHGLTLAGAGGLLGHLTAWGAESRNGPVDCGPPPPPKKQNRTGGESFAPLPLPVTPLRRTEKKRPPAPPALIGKMAMGPIRYVTRDGKRVPYRDWMTDPADMYTLLSWTNEKLGINYRSVNAEFEHFSFDPRELPGLLFSGHNSTLR